MSYVRQTFTNGQTLTHTHMNHIEQGLQDLSDQFDEGGAAGQDGADGATFTPSVSAAGVISWTNNKGLANPTAVNIKGPAGATPVRGTDYWTEADKAEIKGYVDEAILGGEW